MKNFLSKTFEELNKSWIGVDLDGTLAKYDKWRGIDHIGDPIPEMIKKVKKALDDGIIIKIFTARVSSDDFEPKGREAIEKFCKDNFGLVLPITNVKDNSCIEIWDDRAKQVIKNTGEFRESSGMHMEKFESDGPTEAQIKAGNYKKYHMRMNGIKITIENPAGSYRSGKDDDGNEWKIKMNHHYGYIKSTIGRDKDHVDVYVNPQVLEDGLQSPGDRSANNAKTIDCDVYIVNQVNPKTGIFDEHKVMLGFESEDEAKKAYLSNYEKDWKGLGSIKTMKIDEFKKWVYNGTKNSKAESLLKKFESIPSKQFRISNISLEKAKELLFDLYRSFNLYVFTRTMPDGIEFVAGHTKAGARAPTNTFIAGNYSFDRRELFYVILPGMKPIQGSQMFEDDNKLRIERDKLKAELAKKTADNKEDILKLKERISNINKQLEHTTTNISQRLLLKLNEALDPYAAVIVAHTISHDKTYHIDTAQVIASDIRKLGSNYGIHDIQRILNRYSIKLRSSNPGALQNLYNNLKKISSNESNEDEMGVSSGSSASDLGEIPYGKNPKKKDKEECDNDDDDNKKSKAQKILDALSKSEKFSER